MPTNNSFQNATSLSLATPASGSVATDGQSAFYSLVLASSGRLRFDLTGLTGDADIRVWYLAPGAAEGTQPAFLGLAANAGAANDGLELACALPGMYFAEVVPVSLAGASTPFTLAATVAPATVAVVSLQYAVIGGAPQMGASEGNAAGNIQFEIRRDGDTSGTSVVQYEIGAPGDHWFPPASPQDLSAAYSVFPSALVTFAPGESVKTVTLPLQDDALVEPWEAFAVRLSNPSGAVIGHNAAFGQAASLTLTIEENDPNTQPMVSVTPVGIAGQTEMGQIEGSSFAFNLAIDQPQGTDTVLAWHVVAGDNGVTPGDFAGGTLPAGTATILAGQTVAQLTVATVDDSLLEWPEWFNVRVDTVNGEVARGQNMADAMMVDNEDDFANTSALATSEFAPGGMWIGTIDSTTDRDVIKVTLQAGRSYIFEAAAMDDDWAVDPFMRLLDAAGNVVALASNSTGTTDARIAYTPTANQAYYLDVSGSSGSTGSYLVQSRVTGSDDFAPATPVGASWPNTRTGLLAIPEGVATGFFEGNDDEDAFRVALTQGKAYRLEFLFTPDTAASLRITDGAGNAYQPDSTTVTPTASGFMRVQAEFVAQASGEFTVITKGGVAGAGNPASVLRPYRLHIRERDNLDSFHDHSGTPTVSVIPGGAYVMEGSGTAQSFYRFYVLRDGNLSASQSVNWAVGAPGTTGLATLATDFVGSTGGAITFAPGEDLRTIDVRVNNDTTAESDESFTVTLSAPTAGLTLGTASASGLIRDDDTAGTAISPIYSISAVDTFKDEGNAGASAHVFRINRTGLLGAASSVDWTVVGSVAYAATGIQPASPDDFTDAAGNAVLTAMPGGTVSFNAGANVALVTIYVKGDTNFEPGEGFSVNLSNPTGTGITEATAASALRIASAGGGVRNDDVQPGPTYAFGAASPAPEGEQSFTVLRSGDISLASLVNWRVTTAAAPAASVDANDFNGGVLPTGTLSFSAGQTAATLVVPAIDDSVVEPNENYSVSLFLTGAAAPLASIGGTLGNNDAQAQLPSVSLVQVTGSVAEGDSGSTSLVIDVQRSGDLSGASSVNWAVVGGSANSFDFAGAHFPAGTVSFAAQQSLASIVIEVAGDTAPEAVEDFNVVLSMPVGATLGGSNMGGYSITDNDSIGADVPGNASSNASVGVPGGVGGQVDTNGDRDWYRVSLAAGNTYVFDLVGTGSTNTWGLPGTWDTTLYLRDAAGNQLAYNDDGGIGGGSRIVHTATQSGQYFLDVGGYGGNIGGFRLDVDGGPLAAGAASGGVSATWVGAVADVVEGNAGRIERSFRITRGGDLTAPASVPWRVDSSANGNGLSGADFDFGGALPAGVATFSAGQSEAFATIAINGDSAAEFDEEYVVIINGAAAVGATIRDDDSPSSYNLTDITAYPEYPNSFNEALAPARSYRIDRTGNTALASVVNWRVEANGQWELSGQDFAGGVLPSGSVSFAAGQISANIGFGIANDGVAEPDVNFYVVLTAPDGAPTVSYGNANITATINDDDRPGDINISHSLDTAQQTEGNSAAHDYVFTVSRYGGRLDQPASVGWGVASADGMVDGPDFAGGVPPAGNISFAAGQTSATLTVAISGDTLPEGNETFYVRLNNGNNVFVDGSDYASASIFDDDTPPQLSGFLSPAAVDEGAAGTTVSMVLTATRSATYPAGNLGMTSTVDWRLAGYGSQGTDAADFFGPTAGSITFAPGVSELATTIVIQGDDIPEEAENFQVLLSNPGNLRLPAGNTVAGTIYNDDGAAPVAGYHLSYIGSVNEGSGGTTPVVLSLHRVAASGAESLAWAVRPGYAQFSLNGADFDGGALPGGNFVFADGVDMATATLLLAADSLGESDERFEVYLPGHGEVAAMDAMIMDDDRPPQLAIYAANSLSSEGGDVVFEIGRSDGNLALPSTVDWMVSPHESADTTPADFVGNTFPAGSVTFAPGETVRQITVAVADDAQPEPGETFYVDLRNPTNARLNSGSYGSAAIPASDQPPTLGVGGTTYYYAEGTPAEFTVNLSAPAAEPVIVNWRADGIYVAPEDFAGGVFPSGVLTIAAGLSSATLTVAIAQDSLAEGSEGFNVTLTGAVGATLGYAANASAGITDDDPPATAGNSYSASMSSGPANSLEGAVGTQGDWVFQVSNANGLPGSVAWRVAASAADGADFAGGVLPAGVVSFAPGQYTANVTVSTVGDALMEGDEAWSFVLSDPVGGTLASAQALTETLYNDDGSPSSFSLSNNYYTSIQLEGGAGSAPQWTFTVNRSQSAGAASVSWEAVPFGSNAVNGADFGGNLPNGALNFADGVGAMTFTVTPQGDSTVEVNENFLVRLINPSAGTGLVQGADSIVATLANDDGISVPSAVNLDSNLREMPWAEGGSGTSAYVFRLYRNGGAPGGATVAWAVAGVGPQAANATDFAGGTLPAGTVTFGEGQIEAFVTVLVQGDATVEPNESFQLVLSNASGPNTSLGSATTAVGTINDDDAPEFSIYSHYFRNEGNSGNTPYTFTVNRSGSTADAASVGWRIQLPQTPGVGLADATDFGTPNFGTVTFARGQASVTLTVNIAGDATLEADESFTVMLENPSSGTTISEFSGSSMGQILDDDTPGYAFTSTYGYAREGSGLPVVLSVNRNGPTNTAGSVLWAVQAQTGTGVTAADFGAAALPVGTLTFAANQASAQLTINIANDTERENWENFSVVLSAVPGSNAAISSSAGIAQVSIQDDDSPGFSVTGAAIMEGNAGNTTMVFRVTRSGPLTGAESVTISVSPESAAADDFAGAAFPAPAVLDFAIGQTAATYTVSIAGDSTVEGHETFSVTLSTPSGNATILDGFATGTILNDDGDPGENFATALALGNLVSPVNLTSQAVSTAPDTFRFDLDGVRDLSISLTGLTADADLMLYYTDPSIDYGSPQRLTAPMLGRGGILDETLTLPNAPAGIYHLQVQPLGAGTVYGLNLATVAPASAPVISVVRRVDDSSMDQMYSPITEGSGAAAGARIVYDIRRSGNLGASSVVPWRVDLMPNTTMTPLTMASAADFLGNTAPAGSVTFAANEAVKSVTITLAGDTLTEGMEGYYLALSNPTSNGVLRNSSVLGQQSSVYTSIQDDDPNDNLPVVGLRTDIGVPVVAEGNSGTTPLVFEIFLDQPLSGAAAATANWAVRSSSDAEPIAADFATAAGAPLTAFPSGIVTFGGTVTAVSVTVNVAADTVWEVNDNFHVSLTGVSGARIQPSGTTYSTSTTALSLTVLNDDDEFSADATTHGAIAAGGNRRGGIQTPGDHDWIKVNLSANRRYQFEVDATSPFGPYNTAALDPFLTLRDASGNAVAMGNSSNGTTAALVNYTPVAGGDYYLDISGSGTSIGDYVVASRPSGSDDAPGNVRAATLAVDPYGQAFGWVEGNGDVDAYVFRAEAGQEFNISAYFPQDTSMTFSVLDPANNLVVPNYQPTMSSTGSGYTQASASLMATVSGNYTVLTKGAVSGGNGSTLRAYLLNVNRSRYLDQVDTPIISIQAMGSAFEEGSGGTRPAIFQIRRGSNLQGSQAVSWAVTGNDPDIPSTALYDAAVAADFGAAFPSGTVTFAAGEMVKNITFDIAGDTADEGNEGFAVTIATAAANTRLGSATAYGVIRDDDDPTPPPTTANLSISTIDSFKDEGNSSATDHVFRVNRSGVTTNAVSANWSVVGGVSYTGSGNQAADADDFGGTLPSGTVSFAAGATVALITVQVIGDLVQEPGEGFSVVLANPSTEATIVTASSPGGIRNDDLASLYSFANTPGAITEGTDGVFTLNLGNPSQGGALTWSVAGSGAAPADNLDFGGVLPGGSVSYSAGQSMASFTIGTTDDSDFEFDESFTVNLRDSDGLTVAAASATVANNDNPALGATLSVSRGAAGDSRLEGTGTGTAATPWVFTVNRSGGSGFSSVDWGIYTQYGSGTMALADDFVGATASVDGGPILGGRVTFTGSQTVQTFTVNVAADSLPENEEWFSLNFSNPQGGALSATGADGYWTDTMTQTIGGVWLSNNILNDDDATPATIAGAGFLTAGGARFGDFNGAADQDWYRIELSANTPYVFEMGVGGPGATSPRALLRLLNGSGTAITLPAGAITTTPDGKGTRVTFMPTTDGTYYLSAQNANTAANFGYYGLFASVASSTADDCAGDATTRGVLPPLDGYDDVVGRIDRNGDTDWYRVAVTGGQLARFHVSTGTWMGGGLTVALYDSEGTPIAGGTGDVVTDTTSSPGEDGFNAYEVSYTAPTSGHIYVGVTGGTGASGPYLVNAKFGDNDQPTQATQLAILSPRYGVEGNSAAPGATVFRVARGGSSVETASVDWTLVPGSASADDFTGTTAGTLTFTAGQVDAYISIMFAGDATEEEAETFTVELSNPVGAEIATMTGYTGADNYAAATGVIANDDYGTPNFSVANLSVSQAEGTGTTATTATTPMVFTVERDAIGLNSVVNWSVALGTEDTATADDFKNGTLPSGALTFGPTVNSMTVTVSVMADSNFERNETFSFNLAAGSNANITTPTATGTITNDDLNVFTLQSPATTTVDEAGSVTLTVTRGGSAASLLRPASASWQAQPGTTTDSADGMDFAGGVLPGGILSFTAGQSTATLNFTIADDFAVEPEESFTVRLGALDGQPAVDPDHAAVDFTIAVDADDTGFVDAAGNTLEDAGDLGLLTAQGIVASDWVGDSDGLDYYRFVAGGSSMSLLLEIDGDDEDGSLRGDADVTLYDALGNHLAGSYHGGSQDDGFAYGALAAGSAYYVLVHQFAGNTNYTLTLGGATGSVFDFAAEHSFEEEGSGANTGFVYTVTRSGDTSGTASVDWTLTTPLTAPGGADLADVTGDSDFAALTGTVSFGDGVTTATFTVSVLGDSTVESDEVFAVQLGNPSSGSSVAPTVLGGYIRNDDVADGGGSMDSPTELGALTAGTPIVNADFVGAADTLDVYHFTTGNAAAVNIVLSGLANDADLTLLADLDADGTIDIATEAVAVSALGGTAADTVRAVLQDGIDYYVAVAAFGDTRYDLTVTGIAALPTLDIAAPATIQEGTSGTTTAAVFTVTRSGDLSFGASARWAVDLGSGATAAEAADFARGTLPSGMVSFAPNASTAAITIGVAGDLDSFEGDETFSVTLTAPVGAELGTSATAAATITNFGQRDLAGNTRTTPRDLGHITDPQDIAGLTGVTVGAATVDRTDWVGAADRDDFYSFVADRSGTLTLELTEKTAGTDIKVVLYDAGGSYLAISTPVGTPVSASTQEQLNYELVEGSTYLARVYQRNGDSFYNLSLGIAAASRTTLAIAASDAELPEGDSGTTPFTFEVTRGGDLTGVTTAAWTASGAAFSTVGASANDFAAAGGTVTFTAGQSAAMVTVDVSGDANAEGNELFTVTLAESADYDIEAGSALGLIVNDDFTGSSVFAVEAANADRAEGDSGTTPYTFTLTRSGGTDPAAVNWRVIAAGDGSVAGATDFRNNTFPTGAVSFARNQTAAIVTVLAAADTGAEADESFALVLTSASNGSIDAAAGHAFGAIRNDDVSYQLLPATVSVGEGDGAEDGLAYTPVEFVIVSSAISSVATVVNWRVVATGLGTGVAAAAATDFVGGAMPSGAVTFGAGIDARTITINVANDMANEADEGFRVELLRGTTALNITSTATITNDDSQPIVGILGGTTDQAEGGRPGSTTGTTPFTYVVTRTGNVSAAGSVTWTVAGRDIAITSGLDESAESDDFVATTGTVSFAANQTSALLTVSVVRDLTDEDDEAFSVTLAGAGVPTGGAVAYGFIRNDDVTVPDLAGDEAGTARDLGTLTAAQTVAGERVVADTDANDYYRFTLASMADLRMQLAAVTTAGVTLGDADIAIEDASGTTIGVAATIGDGIGEDLRLANLAPGTYYARVFGASGTTPYRLTLAPTLVADTAGNTLAAARNAGTLGATALSFRDVVGGTDQDYYRFTTVGTSDLTVALTGLTANAPVALLDSGGNFVAGVQTETDGYDQALTLGNLAAGTYTVWVAPPVSGTTAYSLTLSAPPSADSAGNAATEAAARAVTLTAGATAVTRFVDAVSDFDRDDYYRVRLSSYSNLRVALAGPGTGATASLAADVDVELLDAAGNRLANSTAGGTASEAISFDGLASGVDYYVHVYQFSGSSGYGLNLQALRAAPTDTARDTAPLATNLTPGTRTLALGGSLSANEWVGSGLDGADWYRFTVAAATANSGDLRVALTGLSADADVEVYASTGTGTAMTAAATALAPASGADGGGALDDILTYSGITAGSTYFVKVVPGTEVFTNFSLALTLQRAADDNDSLAAADAITPGTTVLPATLLATTTPTVAQGFVGAGDVDDWYSFSLTGTRAFDLRLTGMSTGADADVELYSVGTGNTTTLVSSASAGGNANERIAATLAAGNYAVKVHRYAGDTSYNLTAAATAPLDSGAGLAAREAAATAGGTAAAVSRVTLTNASQTISGYVGSLDENDWYQVTLTAASDIHASLTGTGATLDLRRAASATIATTTQVALTDGVATGLQPGTYYLNVARTAADVEADYSLAAWIEPAAPTDTGFGATTATARVVTFAAGAASFSQFIGYGTGTAEDTADMYRVTLTGQGGRIAATLAGLGANADLTLFAADGSTVQASSANTGTADDSFTSANLSAGTYYLSVTPGTDAQTAYTLALRSLARDDYSANIATAAVIAPPLTGETAVTAGMATGNIELAGDTDWVKVSLPDGIWTVRQVRNGATGLADAFIQGIYDFQGNRVGDIQNDDVGTSGSQVIVNGTTRTTVAWTALDAQVTLTVDSDSDGVFNEGSTDYYIAAGANGNATGAYRVTVANANQTPELLNPVRNQVAMEGQPFSLRLPWNVFRDPEGGALTLTAQQRDGTALSATNWLSYDADAQMFTGTPTAGTGDVVVRLRATDAGNLSVDNVFTISTPARNDDFANDYADAQDAIAPGVGTVAVGGQTRGRIEAAYDTDWFSVGALTQGDTYQIDLRGAGGAGSLADPYLRGVYDSAGNLIAGTSNDNASGSATLNARVAFTPRADGTYYISAGATGNRGGAYVVSVTRQANQPPTVADSDSATAGTQGYLTDQEAREGQAWRYQVPANAFTDTDPLTYAATLSSGAALPSWLSFNAATRSFAATAVPANAPDLEVRVTARDSAGGTVSDDFVVRTRAATTTATATTTAAASTAPTWTIMVYMAADNNLESYALKDINEMEAARLPSNVRVVVQLDRAPGYANGDGNWTDTRRGLIRGDSNPNAISSPLATVGEKNMGDGATLTEFINYASSTYAADNYALVIWDHGGGLSGTAWDDTNGHDNLSVAETTSALADSNLDGDFDMVGFDTCLQGMVEQAADLAGQTDYVVASQNLEPGDGWNYTRWLRSFSASAGLTGRGAATAAVTAYGAAYNNQETLSAIDTSRVDELTTALNDFIGTVGTPTGSTRTALRNARGNVTDFNDMNYLDLGGYMANVAAQTSLSSSIRAAASAVSQALDQAVVADTNVNGASGLSIFLPGTATAAASSDYTSATYRVLSDTRWNSFIAGINAS